MACDPICRIYTICQRKFNPPEICKKLPVRPIRNGFAAMANQEQCVRMDAIENRGDFG